jgi:N-acetyl-anhydromuramyl-L-alanine amidase AmpD
MKATDIANQESDFQITGIDGKGKKFILSDTSVPIPGEAGSMAYTSCTQANNDSSFYYTDLVAKKKITLHFTMGYLKGDIATLSTPSNHVSVPFVVGRNGKTYNLFASKYWSYHLGPSAVGGNQPMSQSCIGIEISNIGPLKKIGSNLVTSYSDSDVYCQEADTQFYTALATPYRGFSYYATFTDAQYETIITLLRYLTSKYGIPRQFVDAGKRYNTLTADEFVNFTGIVSHVNCRTDKVDIGPAFDWDRVIAGVTAPAQQSV